MEPSTINLKNRRKYQHLGISFGHHRNYETPRRRKSLPVVVWEWRAEEWLERLHLGGLYA